MIVESPPAPADESTPSAPVSADVATDTHPASAPRWSAVVVVVVVWLLFAGGITLFIAFARVPIAAGWRQGRSMRVVDIWSLFTLELAQVAGPLIIPALVTGLVLLVLAGSLLCLWLAMAVTSDETSERAD